MRKSLLKRAISIVMCLAMLLNYMPPIVLAANENYPGMPDGMQLASSAKQENFNGGTANLWFVPCSTEYNKSGDIKVTATGKDFIAEATPNPGYVFSHWATYAIDDNVLGNWEGTNNADGEEWLFSKVGDKTEAYDKKEIQIQVNAGDWNDADRYRVYAVFIKGYNVNVTVGDGVAYEAINISNYDYETSSYEVFYSGNSNSSFIVPEGIELRITHMTLTDGYFIKKILINGVDKTSEYDSEWSHLKIYNVSSTLNIEIITEKNEYTISYHGNGGLTDEGEDLYTQTYKHGDNPNLTENQFKNEGKFFSNWSTKEDGTGNNFSDKNKFELNKNIDLYAIWNDSHEHNGMETDGICDTCGMVSYLHREWDESKNEVVSYEQLTPIAPTKLDNETSKNALTGWVVAEGNVEIDNRIEINGTLNLILLNGSSIKLNAGIHVGKETTLNIYGQNNSTGVLSALSNMRSWSAVGGVKDEDSGHISICGGHVICFGYEEEGIGPTAIGGGSGGAGNVTLLGGILTSKSVNHGSAIGGRCVFNE